MDGRTVQKLFLDQAHPEKGRLVKNNRSVKIRSSAAAQAPTSTNYILTQCFRKVNRIFTFFDIVVSFFPLGDFSPPRPGKPELRGFVPQSGDFFRNFRLFPGCAGVPGDLPEPLSPGKSGRAFLFCREYRIFPILSIVFLHFWILIFLYR